LEIESSLSSDCLEMFCEKHSEYKKRKKIKAQNFITKYKTFVSYKWKILFIANASDSKTRKEGEKLFNILAGSNFHKEVAVLVAYNTKQGPGPIPTLTQTIVYEFEFNKLTDKRQPKIVGEPFIGDFGDEKTLIKILRKINEGYAAERDILFTWDHGVGFGIFSMNPNEHFSHEGIEWLNEGNHDSNPPRFEVISSNDEDLKFNQPWSADPGANMTTADDFHEFVATRKKLSMLTNDELAKAIANGYPKGKVDITIMMNCWMMLADTIYSLKGATSVLIASQSTQWWAGYDYKGIIDLICSDQGTTGDMIGKISRFALDSIRSNYIHNKYGEYIRELSFLAVDLRDKKDVTDFYKNFLSLADKLKEQVKQSFQAIKKQRENCFDFSDDPTKKREPLWHYIDLLNFFDKLYSITLIEKEDIFSLKEDFNKLYLDAFRGQNYNSKNEQTDIFKANGISIYFPPDFEGKEKDDFWKFFYENGKHQSLLAKEKEWKLFLDWYYEADRVPQ